MKHGIAIAAVLLLAQVPAAAQAGQAGRGRGAGPAAPAAARAAAQAPDLSGYWLGSYFVGLQNIETAKGVIVEPAGGKIPYLPEMAAKARIPRRTIWPTSPSCTASCPASLT